MALRLFWTYPHLVARFQEVSLFLDCGLQVVCADDELPAAEADRSYYDERSPYYPRWREFVDIPSSVLEKLRRVNIYQTGGQLSVEQRALINEFIDIIYVIGNPGTLRRLGSWFRGTLLYRVMGYPNWTAQNTAFREANAIVSSPEFIAKFLYAPAYTTMTPNRFGHVARDVLAANPWVERQRLPQEWEAERSEARAVSAISYIHFHSYFRDQYRTLTQAFQQYPLSIVGKNDLQALDWRDPRILGHMSFEELYRTIAQGRVFVEAGACPNHVIWPPLEAAVMGVPVLFVRTSGLVDPLRAGGHSMADLRGMGMFDSFADIQNFLLRHGDDIPLLREIAIRQKRAMVDHVFSRDNAKRALLKGLVQREAEYANPLRKDRPRRILPIPGRRQEPPVQQQLAPLFLDAGENRWFMPQQMRFLAGRVERRNNGRPTLVLQPGRDAVGQVIETYLPPVRAGWYIATLMVEVYEKLDAPALTVELGPWRDGAFQPEQRDLHTALPGLAEFEFDLSVREGEEEAQRELRVRWSGKVAMGVIGLRLDPAPYPAWLAPHQRP